MKRVPNILWFSMLMLMIFSHLQVCRSQAVKPGDHLSYLDNGNVRLGVDLNLGGSIIYFARSGNHRNMVNYADRGREIQMSNYSGPVPYLADGKKPMKMWAGLGWNPIQCGDVAGNSSKLLAFHNTGKEIYVKCIPMQWPLDNVPGSCTFECWITLKGGVANIRCRVVNHRKDHTQYAARGQELPAVYTNGPWYRLFSYTGDKPFTNGPLTRVPTAFPWSHLRGTEHWVALVDKAGNGLGVFTPDCEGYGAGFFGTPGSGVSSDNATGYIGPTCLDILDYNITYQYHYTLIAGSLDEIRHYVYRHSAPLSPPSFTFSQNRQHWYYMNAHDTGWPIRGELNIIPDTNSFKIISPTGFWSATSGSILTVNAAFKIGAKQLRIFWETFNSPSFTITNSKPFSIIDDGRFHLYHFNMASSAEYQGDITKIGIMMNTDGAADDNVRIKSISFK